MLLANAHVEYYVYTIALQYLPRLELTSSHLFIVCLFVCCTGAGDYMLDSTWRDGASSLWMFGLKEEPDGPSSPWQPLQASECSIPITHYQVLRDLDEDCMIEVWGWAVLLVIRYHAKKEMSQGPPLLGVWDSVIWVKKLQLSPCNSTDMWGTRLGPFQP